MSISEAECIHMSEDKKLGIWTNVWYMINEHIEENWPLVENISQVTYIYDIVVSIDGVSTSALQFLSTCTEITDMYFVDFIGHVCIYNMLL